MKLTTQEAVMVAYALNMLALSDDKGRNPARGRSVTRCLMMAIS